MSSLAAGGSGGARKWKQPLHPACPPAWNPATGREQALAPRHPVNTLGTVRLAAQGRGGPSAQGPRRLQGHRPGTPCSLRPAQSILSARHLLSTSQAFGSSP